MVSNELLLLDLWNLCDVLQRHQLVI